MVRKVNTVGKSDFVDVAKALVGATEFEVMNFVVETV